MNNYYSLIDITLQEFNWCSTRGDLVQEYDTTFTNLSYYKLTDASIISKIFPSRILDIGEPDFKFVELTGLGVVYPHVDYGAKAVLNYYFQPSNSVTRFYNKKDISITDDTSRTHLFKYSDIIFVDSFIAKQHECYLLNVEQIHEVIHTSDSPRQFIQIQWANLDYSYVLNKLNDIGNC